MSCLVQVRSTQSDADRDLICAFHPPTGVFIGKNTLKDGPLEIGIIMRNFK